MTHQTNEEVSSRVRALISKFAAEWLADTHDATDHEFLCACVERIVDDAVRDAIITAAKVFRPEASE
jgi:ribosomal protein S20